MAYNATVYKIFIASPGDTREERDIVEQIIHDWNIVHASDKHIVLQCIRYEKNAHADSGKTPQELINEQILDDADLLIAIFKFRIGSPTNTNKSGTIEEIEKHMNLGKKVMLFFYSGNILMPETPNSIDDLKAIIELKQKYNKNTFYREYKDLNNFRNIFSNDFNQAVNRYFIIDSVENNYPTDFRNLYNSFSKQFYGNVTINDIFKELAYEIIDTQYCGTSCYSILKEFLLKDKNNNNENIEGYVREIKLKLFLENLVETTDNDGWCLSMNGKNYLKYLNKIEFTI